MDFSLEELEAGMRRGIPVEDLLKEFGWKDFEGVVAEIFSANGFRTFRNLRFSSRKRRYEVDVVALERPRAVVADCKHWGLRPGKGSALKAASLNQLNRAVELSKKIQELPVLGIGGWGTFCAVPILVTLHQEGITENGGVLVVPLFRLNSFVDELRSGLFDSMQTRIQTIYSWCNREDER